MGSFGRGTKRKWNRYGVPRTMLKQQQRTYNSKQLATKLEQERQ